MQKFWQKKAKGGARIKGNGRFFNGAEDQQRAHVCVIGSEAKTLLFSGGYAIGETIRLNGVIFTVIGVLTPKMQEGDDDRNRIIYIPFNTMSDLVSTHYLDGIWFNYRGNHELVEKSLRETMAAAHHFRPSDHNALNVDFFLRIATELRLKRLLVGGFDRVFEIGRIFRNEGVSRRHNPEFTMLEVYEAYSDYRGMMRLIQDLLTTLVRDVIKPADGSLRIKHAASGQDIDFGGTWREVRYKDLIIEVTGDAGWFARPKAEKVAQAEALGLAVNPAWEEFEITNEIFSKKIEPTLIQPTFITHLPKELCPLAKLNADDPSVLDVFELTIGGMEIAPAYSEQNDPDVQRAMFQAQAGEEQQNIDQDFLLALEHGMPPAGGMGVGIDRLCILLTGAESIRDVILFPQLRPGSAASPA